MADMANIMLVLSAGSFDAFDATWVSKAIYFLATRQERSVVSKNLSIERVGISFTQHFTLNVLYYNMCKNIVYGRLAAAQSGLCDGASQT